MHARCVHGLTLHFDDAALKEYLDDPQAFDHALQQVYCSMEPLLTKFGQPCPIWVHGLDGCWKYGHDVKKRMDGFDLGDAEHGIKFYGNMPYPDIKPVNGIFLINTSKRLLAEPSLLLALLSRAYCDVLTAPAPSTSPAEGDTARDSHASTAAVPPPPPPPIPPPGLVESDDDDRSPFPLMHARRFGCLRLLLDESALDEYHQAHSLYDAIFEHSSEAIRPMVDAVGQCPIWLHGLSGCWKHGYERKLCDGFDLGCAEKGIAFHGNMLYAGPDGTDFDVDVGVFLINLPRAVLGHPMVFVHELTHHFHLSRGPERLPGIRCAFERTCARVDELRARFAAEVGRNPIQFEYTLSNEFEFFAYMMEALHSPVPNGSSPTSSARYTSVIFEAPAFPRTRAELLALDEALGLGIVSAIEEAVEGSLRLPPAPSPAGVGGDEASRVDMA